MRSACATASSSAPAAWRPLAAAALAGPPGAVLAVMLARAGGVDGAAPGRDAATLLLLLVVAPVLEETVFRAGLQSWLQRRAVGGRRVAGLDAAVLLTALAFAAAHLVHAPPLLAAMVFVPGLAIGEVYRRIGRLRPVIVLHAWYNGCLLAAAALLPN